MKYKGYNIFEEDNRVIVENIKDFNATHIFECGQCFRWKKQQDLSFTGIANNRVINIKINNDNLEISNTNIKDFQDIWFDYFDLGRDYKEIKKLLEKDEIMKSAIKFGEGIRILKQDIQEILVSFIISANNRIPRIMNSVELLSHKFGDEVFFDGKKYYTFPNLKDISNADLEEIKECKAGFRCKYIHDTAKMELENEYLKNITNLTTDEARTQLMKFCGVGPKVADCILLFSAEKTDVFPIDVWVKRVMEELYFHREATLREIQVFVKDYFGELSGFAQQYLFYYAREKKIGL